MPTISLMTASIYCHQCHPRPPNLQLPVWLTAQSMACSASQGICVFFPGSGLNVQGKKTPLLKEKLHWSQLCQISFGSTWRGFKRRAIPATGCLDRQGIKTGSYWHDSVLDQTAMTKCENKCAKGCFFLFFFLTCCCLHLWVGLLIRQITLIIFHRCVFGS